MQAEELRALQATLKQHYREQPQAAMITLAARGNLDEGITCRSKLARHLCKLASTLPRVGTAWRRALAICCCKRWSPVLGSRFRAVATALGVPVHGGTVTAEGGHRFSWYTGRKPGGAGGLRRYPFAFQTSRRMPPQHSWNRCCN